ncbi:MAG: phosphatase PAP2 family protein [Bacteroidota bacterium]|jgi:undecaprenyl-diphosphatase
MLFVLDFFDRDLFVLINQRWASPALDPMMIFLSSKWAFVPLYAVFIWLFWRKFGVKCWVPILLTVASFGLADSISSKICKPMFARVRPAWESSLNPRLPDGPPGSRFGFVSSHSANSFAVFSTAMMLLGLGRRWRLGLMYLATAIAYSRVYLGVHYVGDVFFGALLGLGIAYGLLWLYRNQLSPRMEQR